MVEDKDGQRGSDAGHVQDVAVRRLQNPPPQSGLDENRVWRLDLHALRVHNAHVAAEIKYSKNCGICTAGVVAIYTDVTPRSELGVGVLPSAGVDEAGPAAPTHSDEWGWRSDG